MSQLHQQDFIPFLPHAPISRTSRTPPNVNVNLPSQPRQRTRSYQDGSGSSSGSGSRSAPSSPTGRLQGRGMAPLSSISPMSLVKGPEGGVGIDGGSGLGYGYQRPVSRPLPGHVNPQYRGIPVPSVPQPIHPLLANPIVSTSSTRNPTRPSSSRHLSRSQSGSSSSSRSRSGTKHRNPDSSDTEVESDSTFVPGRKSKGSYSQPDLTALRNWAGDVARGHEEDRRAREGRVKMSPINKEVGLVGISKSTGDDHASVLDRRKSTSPRTGFSPLRPLSPSPTAQSDRSLDAVSVTGAISSTSSEDADDDYDSDSVSSGSLSFTSKRSKGLRQRPSSIGKGLGLSINPPSNLLEDQDEDEPLPVALERLLQQSTLLPLRLLAIIPSLWGVCVLARAMVMGGLWHDVWPWGVDLSRDAMERLVQGGEGNPGVWRLVPRGDMALSIAWAICTGHFCFRLTTGLTHRWRSYYSLPSTITRLISLQCLCWPMTYLTLWFLGPARPLLAWIVIGVTTGWSRTVQMWVTSNVIPASAGGDVTPKLGRRVLPVKREREREREREGAGTAWERFTFGRTWDWDDVAREVGWKVGGLLLITTAWLFWEIEMGVIKAGTGTGPGVMY